MADLLYFKMQLLQAEIAMNGMIAENKQRETEGASMAYTEKDFISSNNTVTGNTCNNGTCGIYLSISSNNTITGNTCIRGNGLSSDYTSEQYTLCLSGTDNNYNLIACNNIMGKNYTSEGGTGNTFVNNKYN